MDNGDIKKILAGVSLATLLTGAALGVSGCASSTETEKGSSCSGMKKEAPKSSCSGEGGCSGKMDDSGSGKSDSSCSGK